MEGDEVSARQHLSSPSSRVRETKDAVKDGVTYEYGLRLDCAANGCVTPHSDNGRVLPNLGYTRRPTKINGHAVNLVRRSIGPWEPA